MGPVAGRGRLLSIGLGWWGDTFESWYFLEMFLVESGQSMFAGSGGSGDNGVDEVELVAGMVFTRNL